ncbi:MAG: hypothetical protein A2104_04485 [Candidatus Melainabacteria bacterium GWF2_32_7]|nr:MAG: hypothetical protein A2104_04485 [Candidatus Melainabacteria bacterium GWF2_32_7]
MELRDLSKMQIRADVMMILQQLSVYDEVPKALQNKCLTNLNTIKNKDYVLEILVKEFAKADYNKGQIIVHFLSELGTLDKLKAPLWSYIKDPKMPDLIKDLSGIILRNLGDDSDPEKFLSYLDNPKDVIDKETKKILEMAVVNPEAQIDFMDFLFSLPESEQIVLINSLKGDYPDEYLANILITTLDSQPSDKLEEILIEALGETKSQLSVPVLTRLMESGKTEYAKKLARKSLNMLKLAGINIQNYVEDKRGYPICQISKIHECYTNIVDGAGSQGIIISRIKDNKDILMFSVVVSDQDGIVGCFGFNGISEEDFGRIILRFNEESSRVSVSPEYCKYILAKAEKINEITKNSIPYEYMAWKSLLYDINELEPIENEVIKWSNSDCIMQGNTLYKHHDFQHWFLDDTDHPMVKEVLDNIIQHTLEKKQYFIENPEEYLGMLEEEITGLTTVVFDENWCEIYKNRLINVAYLLDCQGLDNFKKIASSVALSLNPECSYPVEESPFIRELFRKTICEGFLRYQHNIEQQQKSANLVSSVAKKVREFNNIPKTDITKQGLSDIIDILYDNWQKY